MRSTAQAASRADQSGEPSVSKRAESAPRRTARDSHARGRWFDPSRAHYFEAASSSAGLLVRQATCTVARMRQEGEGISSFDEGRTQRWVRWILVSGLALQLLVNLAEPEGDDVRHFEQAAAVFLRHGFHSYSYLNAFDPARPFDYRAYSYPPGFVLWLLLAHPLTGHAFAIVARLPPVLANVVLAWLIQDDLRDRNATSKTRLAAVALVMFGPLFISVSSATGQIDGLAFVPVVLALIVWRRRDGRSRAIASGLLLAAGGLIKLVPLLFVGALLPTARSLREAAVLIASSIGLVICVLAPFLAADPHGVIHSLDYGGFPGGGGLAVITEPGLARHFLGDYTFHLSPIARALEHHGIGLTLVAYAVVVGVLIRRRVPAAEAAFIVSLTLLVFAVNFYEQYLLWLLPIALLCGRVAMVFVIEVAMTVYLYIEGSLPTHWLHLDGRDVPEHIDVFIASIYALWILLAIVLIRELARILRDHNPAAPAPIPAAPTRA
jgi:Glycosyltransferase family 87